MSTFIKKMQSLPSVMINNSHMTINEISRISGLEIEHLYKLSKREIKATLEDIESIQFALGIDDDDIAIMLEEIQ